MRFSPDSSVIVAAVSVWHQHHSAALRELDRRLEAGHDMVVAGHSLAEAYAVLTRLPSPHRLSGSEAARLIVSNFVERSEVIALDSDGYRSLLEDAPTLDVAGGQTYDMVIAQTATRADVQILVTFNGRHYRRFAGLDVIIPSDAT